MSQDPRDLSPRIQGLTRNSVVIVDEVQNATFKDLTGAPNLFDPSGRVAGDVGGLAVWFEYEDLTKFDRGQVEAIANWCAQNCIAASLRQLRYVDFSQDALKLIIRDGEKAADMTLVPWGRLYNANFAGGVCFWNDRQSGKLKEFPPLQPYVDDEGKMHLKVKGKR